MKVYTVTVLDVEADATAAYVFETEAMAEDFRTALDREFTARSAHWLSVSAVESPDVITTPVDYKAVVAEWMYEND